MTKEPRPGRVKTRLGRDIGMVGAASWFRHQCAGLLRRITDPRWDTVLAVSPDREGLSSRVWPEHLARMPQGRGDIGQRMTRVFRGLPPGPVCIIGADIPEINRAHVAGAFKALGEHSAVFGPAADGGYWLIGLKRFAPPPKTLLANVRWSSEHALSDSLTALPYSDVAFLDTLRDVDTVKDLKHSR